MVKVQNLDDTVAISANFVDSSNVGRAMEALGEEGLSYPSAKAARDSIRRVAEKLESTSTSTAVDVELVHKPYRDMLVSRKTPGE